MVLRGPGPGDVEAYERRGLAVCTLADLGCRGAAGRFSLQTISRFVDVCRSAPGPVAVCGDERLACTLLTAHLLRAGLFADAAEAVSWICIARGAAVAPDYALAHPAGREPGLPRRVLSLMDLAAAAGPDGGDRCDAGCGAAGPSPTDVAAAVGHWGGSTAAAGRSRHL